MKTNGTGAHAPGAPLGRSAKPSGPPDYHDPSLGTRLLAAFLWVGSATPVIGLWPREAYRPVEHTLALLLVLATRERSSSSPTPTQDHRQFPLGGGYLVATNFWDVRRRSLRLGASRRLCVTITVDRRRRRRRLQPSPVSSMPKPRGVRGDDPRGPKSAGRQRVGDGPIPIFRSSEPISYHRRGSSSIGLSGGGEVRRDHAGVAQLGIGGLLY